MSPVRFLFEYFIAPLMGVRFSPSSFATRRSTLSPLLRGPFPPFFLGVFSMGLMITFPSLSYTATYYTHSTYICQGQRKRPHRKGAVVLNLRFLRLCRCYLLRCLPQKSSSETPLHVFQALVRFQGQDQALRLRHYGVLGWLGLLRR